MSGQVTPIEAVESFASFAATALPEVAAELAGALAVYKGQHPELSAAPRTDARAEIDARVAAEEAGLPVANVSER